MSDLTTRIERRIREIPASNPSYISARQETLENVLSRGMLRRIAEVAAAEAGAPKEQKPIPR